MTCRNEERQVSHIYFDILDITHDSSRVRSLYVVTCILLTTVWSPWTRAGVGFVTHMQLLSEPQRAYNVRIFRLQLKKNMQVSQSLNN